MATGDQLTGRDLLVLGEAARQADLIARLEAAIAEEGVLTKGARGQSRVHGAVTALVQARALFVRLLGGLSIGRARASGVPSGTGDAGHPLAKLPQDWMAKVLGVGGDDGE